MADSNISHEVEQRLRNLEAHAGIGHTDEETGEYSVDQHEDVAPPEEATTEEQQQYEVP